jgi:hypothetical protein
MFAAIVAHHVMGLAVAIPMNVHCYDNVYYHEFLFLLQFGAFFTGLCQNYSYTLDVYSDTELATFKIVSNLRAALFLYSRCIRYWYVAYSFAIDMHADGNMVLLCMGITSMFSLGILNTAICIDPQQQIPLERQTLVPVARAA